MISIETGRYSLSSKGKIIKGKVVRFLPREKKITILTEKNLFLKKWEKYQVRSKKIHARVPEQLLEHLSEASIGSWAYVLQRKPVSKTIHYQLVSIV